MSVYLGSKSMTESPYSFFNVDTIYDYLLSIEMKPIVELSFMPNALASKETYIMHYKGNTSPPKNYTQWSDLITAFTSHLIERYGEEEVSQWYFEVWNEPNCDFWSGTQQEYFHMYEVTANAVKKVSPLLRVGGPVTCQSLWIPEFLEFILKNDLLHLVDFIDTHEYPTDITPYQRGIEAQVMNHTKMVVEQMVTKKKLNVYYTEYNSGLFSQPHHDDPYASAFLFYNIPLIARVGLDIVSYWEFSDIFEEQGFVSLPFHQGFGLLNVNEVPKPAYRAFQILHSAGNERVQVVPELEDLKNTTTYGVWGTRNSVNGELKIFLYNHNLPFLPIKEELVEFIVEGAGIESNGFIERIDDDNANAKAAWIKLGSPVYPTPLEILYLKDVSRLQPQEISGTRLAPSKIHFAVSIPPEGVAVVTLRHTSK
eukprot:TRINITY_DN2559_c0_g1_i1.p1 TRINITY_DN2559_c0_g1~~TRINITY_DN2559_c0_g1_i1.p1  ORF type:complete len:462 (-),score=51.38 TRINITY_DN2559_c0_g1_i1:28-1302(-)